jgi:uncharacterized membrane protein
MKLENIKKYMNDVLKLDINALEFLVYFLSSFIIFTSVLNAIYYYTLNFAEGTDFSASEIDILEAKIRLSNSISLALSFILSIEILKIYYIKTYKQLIIVSALVLLKLTVNYFLTLDINDAQKKRSFYSKFVSHGGNGN